MAETAAASPSSLPQSSTGRFEVKSVLTRSCLRMTSSRRPSPAEVGSLWPFAVVDLRFLPWLCDDHRVQAPGCAIE